MASPSSQNQYLKNHVNLLVDSYEKLLGEPFFATNQRPDDIAKSVFYAPFVVLSHTPDSDPVFNYANQRGLELFEFSWDEFIRLPSRLSAEPAHQSEREALLEEVNAKGYIKNYQGIRLSKSGRRFLIRNAAVWNLTDEQNRYAGQAARFSDWEFL